MVIFSVHTRSTMYGLTDLHIAHLVYSDVVDLCFIRAYPPLFLLCLKHGADPNRSLKGGVTFLHIAAHKGESSMMRGEMN